MSDSDDSGSSVKKVPVKPFAFLKKIKSNTPRARFDVHFFSTYITLTQYSVNKEISNQYTILKGNIMEMLRLPYSNGKQFFIVLHLKQPIVGGNKSFTKYDFIVFSFLKEDHADVNLDLSDPVVEGMFSENDDSENISGKTVDVFETLIVKIFEKSIVTPAKNYIGNQTAPVLQCTFWDNDEHFLYPLDNGFVNVWKYCQKFELKDVKNVRFIRSDGRFKTFDFVIYPKVERTIRRYHIESNESKFVHCSSLEFQAIDQKHYEGLFEYCQRNQLDVSTNDLKESASDSSGSDSDNEVSESDGANSDMRSVLDGFEVPDPHLTRCQIEGGENDGESTSGSEESSDTSDTHHANKSYSDETSTSESVKTQTTVIIRPRRKNISDDTEESSTTESDTNTIIYRPKRKSIGDTDQSSTSDSRMDLPESSRRRRRKIISDDSDSDLPTTAKHGKLTSRKRSIQSDSDSEDEIKSKNQKLVMECD